MNINYEETEWQRQLTKEDMLPHFLPLDPSVHTSGNLRRCHKVKEANRCRLLITTSGELWAQWWITRWHFPYRNAIISSHLGKRPSLPKQLPSGIDHNHKPSPWVMEQPRCLQLSTSTPPDSTQIIPHQDFPISEDSREVHRVITQSRTCLWLNETLLLVSQKVSKHWVITMEWYTRGVQKQLD